MGIVSCVISDGEEFQGVGFAATINTARTLLLDRDRFLIGLDGVLVTGIVAKALNIPQSAGFLVTNVARESLAEKMGLIGGQVEAAIDNENLLIGGDVILKINDSTITVDRRAFRSVFSNIARSHAGSTVRFSVLRAGKTLDLYLKIPNSVSSQTLSRSKTMKRQPGIRMLALQATSEYRHSLMKSLVGLQPCAAVKQLLADLPLTRATLRLIARHP